MASEYHTPWNLSGVRAVITGSTKGIGLETAKEFLKLGASVLIISRSPSDVDTVVRELNAAVAPWVGGAPAPAGAAPGASAAVEAAVAVTTAAVATAPAARVFGCPCDVSSDAGRTALVAFVEGTWGGALDVLINNVGVNIRKRLEEATSEEYRTMMATNVDSAYFLSQALYPHLKAAGAACGSGPLRQRPCVVNVSSAAGLTSTGTGAIYGMTKAALVQLTRSLACEWGRDGIRVNCVAPWMTLTPMLNQATKNDPSALDKVRRATPLCVGLSRLPDPRESATTIAFLCMPAAAFVSGQALSVDGAFSAHGFNGPCVEMP